MSKNCGDCKYKTEMLALSSETISKIAARAEDAELQVRKLRDILDACSQQDCSCHRRGVTLCGSCRARNLLYPKGSKTS